MGIGGAMSSHLEKHDKKLQRSANWATILATIFGAVAICIACIQIALQVRTPTEINAAHTLIAIEQEKQSGLATLSVLQTQQAQSDTSSNGINTTQTAISAEKISIDATSQALSTQAAQIQSTIQANVPEFVSVSIKPIANYKMDSFISPISGDYIFKDIPFNLLSGPSTVYQSQGTGSQSVGLEVAIPHPAVVYVLVNGGYVYKSLTGKTAGDIILYFADGTSHSYNLVVGQNFREHWGYDSISSDVITDLNESIDWVNVYYENQSRGNQSAKAFIDMVKIFIPPSFQSTVMTKIEIIDKSINNFGSASPSIIIYGITVDTTP